MGLNSSNYIHSLYQVMNLAFSDRDFYYGDPYFEPKEPINGLLSKDYAKERIKLISDKNNINIKPGDPYKFQKGNNPFIEHLNNWETDNNIDDSVKPFIIRQMKRMPQHYYLAVYILCSSFYFLRIHPSKLGLLEKLIYSLSTIKSFEN